MTGLFSFRLGWLTMFSSVLGMITVIVIWFLINRQVGPRSIFAWIVFYAPPRLILRFGRYAVGMFDALELSLIALQQFAFVAEYKLRWGHTAEVIVFSSCCWTLL